MKRLSCLVFALLAASCGSSSTSPTIGLNLAGTWMGRFEYQTAGATVFDDVTVTILQAATTANGTWSASALTTGTISFPAAATVAGSFTISQPNIASGPCQGSSTISGTATSSDLVLSVANVTPTASCPWATGMKFTLHK